jgi:hypothetical protein
MRRKPSKKMVSVTCRKGRFGLGENLALGMNDISVDGAQLSVKTAFTVGDEIEVCFSAVGIIGRLTREASVAWCSDVEANGYRVGVKFRYPLSYEQIYYMT